MQQQAIEKINTEIAQSNNPYVQVIGQFLLTQITTKDAAERILEASKTVEGSLKAMQEAALKKIKDSGTKPTGGQNYTMAMFTDEEGYAIVLDYFDIEKVEQSPKAKNSPAPSQKTKKSKQKVVNFPGNEYVQTSLDDFWEERVFE